MSNPSNNVQLIGRLTTDPDLRQTPNGKTVCNMRIAVEKMGGDEDTGFIDIAVWGPSAEACARTLTQGWQVAVAGELQIKPWKTDERSGLNIKLPFARVKFLTSPRTETPNEPAAS